MEQPVFWQPPEDDTENDDPGTPIWHRMEGEPPRAYHCFEQTRELGPTRSILASYRQITGKEQAKAPSGTWNGWIKKWRWQERFAASDAADARARRLRLQQEREKAEDRIAEIALAAMERGLERFMAVPNSKFSPSAAANALNLMARLAMYALGKTDQLDVDVDQTHRIIYQYIHAKEPASISLPKSLRPADPDAPDDNG